MLLPMKDTYKHRRRNAPLTQVPVGFQVSEVTAPAAGHAVPWVVATRPEPDGMAPPVQNWVEPAAHAVFATVW